VARNIELKAVARDPARLRERASELSGSPGETLVQEDTFFQCDHGRLKLRDFGGDRGELIWYERSDEDRERQSTYTIAPTASPGRLKAVLAASLGIRGVVAKTRELYLVGQTRIHLDTVEGLGAFVELEYVVADGESTDTGYRVVPELMAALGIDRADILTGAYIDMVLDEAK